MRFNYFTFILLFIATFFLGNSLFAQANNCAGATLIKSDSTCVSGTSMLTAQNLSGATSDGFTIISSCSFAGTANDVWYKFVAKTKIPTVTISNIGAGWGGSANVKIQLLAGSCGSFTEIACASGGILTPILLSPLSEGTTYYIRVHNNTTTVAANSTFDICVTDALQKGSRMNEIFSRTVLSPALAMNYPWEITYGPDDSLWITEARGYKVSKMNAANGGKRTVLDLSFGSTWFGTSGTGDDTLYAQQSATSWNTQGWPQGGLAGLAVHPNFGTGAGKDFVYVTYVWKYLSGNGTKTGVFFQNKLVRFTYNFAKGRLESPAVLDWNLPGSTDHNSQRLIIAPVVKNGSPYLFMSEGDMGAGQFGNRDRPNNAQNSNSYEGKILRFNLEPDADPGYAKWVPNDNPYSATSAVYSMGIRNNQGFAYDTANNILYGTSHGPYSDDEINVIENKKNYGHPLVIGYAADGNYNGNLTAGTSTSVSAGADFTDNSGMSSCPPIGDETVRKNAINTADPGSYRDPLFSAYPTPSAGIKAVWQTPGNNKDWQSEAWSGLDFYTDKIIPGWKRSLVASGLKWGRLIKLNLNATGTATLPSNIGGAVGNASDTITYFQSTNRYRDLAFAPNGKDMFIVMDNTSATSGPGIGNPTTPACPGCVIKYSFLGYADNSSGFSTIPKTIDVTTGTLNTCNSGTPVTIDGTNNFLWVPITGPDGNIMAELNAMGQNMGVVTTSFYKNGSPVRTAGGVKYLDRNITITPTVTSYTNAVKVRLYVAKAELDALIAVGGVTGISTLKINKNNDVCASAIASSTTVLTPVNTALVDLTHGSNGYVLQTAVTSFSSFYFSGNNVVLPLDLITFTGTLQSNLSALLNWKTENEINITGFGLERSEDGNTFNQITFVTPTGNSNSKSNYTYTDNDALGQQSLVLYYRLKIINKNGSFKYSNVISMSLPIAKAFINVAPNPVTNDLRGTIVSPFTANVTLRIFDNTGRLMLQTNTFVKKGTNNFIQNINFLATGAYYLDISGDGVISRTKFQKF